MKFREAAAWVIAVTLGLGWYMANGKIAVMQQTEGECFDRLYACADALHASEQLCTREGAAAMERAVQLFECERDLCEGNGWIEPPDWSEAKKQMLDDPRFREKLDHE